MRPSSTSPTATGRWYVKCCSPCRNSPSRANALSASHAGARVHRSGAARRLDVGERAGARHDERVGRAARARARSPRRARPAPTRRSRWRPSPRGRTASPARARSRRVPAGPSRSTRRRRAARRTSCGCDLRPSNSRVPFGHDPGLRICAWPFMRPSHHALPGLDPRAQQRREPRPVERTRRRTRAGRAARAS